MDEHFKFTNKIRNILLAIAIGGLLLAIGAIVIFKPGASRIWANVLLNNQLFLGIALGGAFFLAVHRIAWSGWHTALQRIPEALTSFLPVAFLLMLLVFFGMNDLYHWSQPDLHDPVLEGKSAWLNMPFFFIRMVLYFTGWILLTRAMRKNTNALMDSADAKFHNRRRIFSGIFLVFFALTVSASSWDWIMSIDAHWYSTIFGWYVFIGMFVCSLAFIILLIWFLKGAGYLEFVRADHIHDLGKLLFAFSIFWTYLWFSQYLLIWYGHIPEETTYFVARQENFKLVFFLSLILNFVVPFFGLMKLNLKKKLNWLAAVAGIVLIGHWIDYYQMIMPGAVGEHAGIGLLEIGLTVCYAGIFLFVVLRALASKPLLVKNDPFLEESLHYES
ncbi:MAG: quinol:cytochrome C oxidoreductase [Bacteroidetes bacterium]|nr:MAG: quinol:cytochrome C oxidoreductase [Bacteroidota bacterium]